LVLWINTLSASPWTQTLLNSHVVSINPFAHDFSRRKFTMMIKLLASTALLALCIALGGCEGDAGSDASPSGATAPRPAPAQPTQAPGAGLGESGRQGGAAPGRGTGGGNTTGG